MYAAILRSTPVIREGTRIWGRSCALTSRN
jgi:hypothetical protein